MRPFTGPYRRVAEALLEIFVNAVARCGICKGRLQLDTPSIKERSNKQWRAFCEHGDSVAFISWCADKINYWHTPEYVKYVIQTPLYGTPKPVPFVIMSPDGKTDWTLAAWHIRFETKSKVSFTSTFIKDLEAALQRRKNLKSALATCKFFLLQRRHVCGYAHQ